MHRVPLQEIIRMLELECREQLQNYILKKKLEHDRLQHLCMAFRNFISEMNEFV